MMGIKLAMSSAHQPSTDGLVERHNQVLEEMLRSYVSTAHDNWDVLLDFAEFAINKATGTGSCPFSRVYFSVPLSPPESVLQARLPKPDKRSRKLARDPCVPDRQAIAVGTQRPDESQGGSEQNLQDSPGR